MRRGRPGVATEVIPLILLLLSLAGSLALVIAIHRRFISRTTPTPAVAVVAPPLVQAEVKPPSAPALPEPEAEEPEGPAGPPPEDPTKPILAKLLQAEADQLLEASKADTKAASIEAATKKAALETEKWRRRESLVRSQLDTLQTQLHKLETKADELTLERDALEKELEIRKALVAQAKSRPSTAILPHRGPNGTWRRPIVVECVNGQAILKPQNIAFGLLELAIGFGPSTNPFVAIIAREALRVQGSNSPDGQLVVPYVFFLIRPDGIRAYYEARGRLEPLGITFGYELADQNWQVDIPDLDDISAWDGSGPAPPKRPDPLAELRSRNPGSLANEEDDPFANLGVAANPGGTGGSGKSNQPGGDDALGGNEFTWPPRTTANQGRAPLGLGTTRGLVPRAQNLGNGFDLDPPPNRSQTGNPQGKPGSQPDQGYAASPGSQPATPRGNPGTSPKMPELPPLSALPPAGGPTPDAMQGNPKMGSIDDAGTFVPPRELNLSGPVASLDPTLPSGDGSATSDRSKPVEGMPGDPQATPPASLPPSPSPSPSVASTNPSAPGSGGNNRIRGQVLASPGAPEDQLGLQGPTTMPQLPPSALNAKPRTGPFARPLASGIDPSLIARATPNGSSAVPIESGSPDGVQSGSATGSPLGDPTNFGSDATEGSVLGSDRFKANPGQPGSAGGSAGGSGTESSLPPGQVAGSPGSAPATAAPPLSVGASFPAGMTPPNVTPSQIPPWVNPNSLPNPNTTFELVVVCGPRGLVIQPGAYRVTSDALRNREGLLRSQLIALVKARRNADPRKRVDPKVRFLVEPGGEDNFWEARGQFMLSGLDWPITTQVADPDVLSIQPSGSW